MRWSFFIAALFGFSAVAFGAFGAHALRDHLDPQMMAVFETAVKYQFYHALTLLSLAFIYQYNSHHYLKRACQMFCLGTVLFSGSLYALVFTEIKKLGIITPFGGVCLLIGWIYLMVFGYKFALSNSRTA